LEAEEDHGVVHVCADWSDYNAALTEPVYATLKAYLKAGGWLAPGVEPPTNASSSGAGGGQTMFDSNQWLIEQYFGTEKRLAYLKGEWLERRHAEGKEDPVNPADSMRQVIAAEKERRGVKA
jgi:hypothetical protein